MSGENGRYVTWNGLIIVALTITALMGGMVSWGWSVHTARPHDGTATHEEFIRLSDTFRTDLIRTAVDAKDDRQQIELQLQRVEDKIDGIEIAVGLLRG